MGMEPESAMDLDVLRKNMARSLQRSGIECVRVLRAMERIAKEDFVINAQTKDKPYSLDQIYGTAPLVVWKTDADDAEEVLRGYRITISAPFIHAWSVQEALLFVRPQCCTFAAERATPQCERPHLEPNILEIGFGSMYQTALLSAVFPHGNIKAIEIVRGLGKDSMARHSFPNVEAVIGDGFQGWTRDPTLKFDVIILSAAPRSVPTTLKMSLKIPGMLIGPVGDAMLRITRLSETEFREETLFAVRFVPMLSKT